MLANVVEDMISLFRVVIVSADCKGIFHVSCMELLLGSILQMTELVSEHLSHQAPDCDTVCLFKHELVTQPHLTRALTLRLLELNRNPDRLLTTGVNSGAPVPKPLAPAAAQTPQSKGPASPALLLGRPDLLPVASPLSSANSSGRESKSSSNERPDSTTKRKPSVGSNVRPQPPETMHTPWSGPGVVSEASSISPDAATPVASPKTPEVNSALKPFPAERIFPVRHATPAGPPSATGEAPVQPGANSLKSLLEKIRIMDELPTPLPAYVAMAPTASPAVKPSGECIKLLTSGKSPKTALTSAHSHKSKASEPVEALVQQVQVLPSVASVPTPVEVRASSASGYSDTSSCASASTSPRSSCSSITMEAVQQAELRAQSSHLSLTNGQQRSAKLSNSSSLVDHTAEAVLPSEEKNLRKSENGSSAVDGFTPSAADAALCPDHLTVFEPVILQDSLEAEFVPIDADALVLSPTPVLSQTPKQLCTEQSLTSLVGEPPQAVDSTMPILKESQDAPLEQKDVDSSSDEHDSHEDYSESDYDDEEEEECEENDLSDDDNYSQESHVTRGTVTTIESNSSASSTEIPPCAGHPLESTVTSSKKAPLTFQANDAPDVVERKITAPYASVENPDEWDLSVADDDLLAADGLLLINRHGTDSASDRISEFGFRIHGNSDGEEDADEEDGEYEDFLEDDKHPLTIPDQLPDLRADLPIPQVTDAQRPRSPDVVGDHLPQVLTESMPANGVVDENIVVNSDQQTNHSTAAAPKKHSSELTYEPEALKEFYPDKSGESTVPPSTLAALTAIQTTKLSLNGESELHRKITNNHHHKGVEQEYNASSLPSTPHISPPDIKQDTKSLETPASPLCLSPTRPTMDDGPPVMDKVEQPRQPLLVPMEYSGDVLLENVSPIDTSPTVILLPTTQFVREELNTTQSGESEIQQQLSSSLLDQSLEQPRCEMSTSVATVCMSEIVGVNDLQSEEGINKSVVSPPATVATSPAHESPRLPMTVPGPKKISRLVTSHSLRAQVEGPTRHLPMMHPATGSLQYLTPANGEVDSPSTGKVDIVNTVVHAAISLTARSSGDFSHLSAAPLPITESCIISSTPHDWNSVVELRQPDNNGVPRTKVPAVRIPSSKGRIKSIIDAPGSRLSMVELTRADERPLYSSSSGIPPTPQVNMGACFSLVFEGCPLKINSTATWVNPVNNGQILLFGTNDGIYYLSLKDLADSSLELLFPRRCLWLSVVRDTMMSLSGRHPQLYCHNLVSLMKLKSQGHVMSGNPSKLGKLTKLFPKRFSPSKKVPDTKGCRRVSVTRSPFNGAKYLCAAIGSEILVMEWFNPVSSFIEIKRIFVPDMPSPLLTFDLLIMKDRPLPLVCLGVYRHHSRQGRENKRYRLQLVDLNLNEHPASPTTVADSSRRYRASLSCSQPTPLMESSQTAIVGSPALSAEDNRKPDHRAEYQRRNALFLPEDSVPVVEVVQLEHNTILVCLQDCAKVISLNGRIKSSRHRATTLDFNGSVAESIVCLRDSILIFHPHGLLGKSFTGELTQEINDAKHIYRLLGCDRNIVVESRPADDPMSNSNVYLLAGHADSRHQ
ncbi:CNH domain protein [Opisthorchis viverrini]|uniref:CNH domain protein n=1 Tax=Opisthorchis viverrini TaxID=6198 RepID=A0A1S8X1D1_OPIVI|nr:CNH domain protein [Opisthorchis viverrini]